MAKKTISKIAAIGLAGLTAFSTVGVAASADVQINTAQEIWGTVVRVTSVTGVKTTYTYNETDKKWETSQAPDTTYDSFAKRTFSTASQASAAWTKLTENKPANGTKPSNPANGATYSTYSFTYTTSSADLSALYGTSTNVKYNAETGEINPTDSSGTSWTVVVGSSTGGTGTSTGSSSSTEDSDVSKWTPAAKYRYATAYVYCSSNTGRYYPNTEALYNVEGTQNYVKSSPAVSYSSSYCYFNPFSGTYSNVGSNYTYVITSSTSSTTTADAVYKVNGYYYATYADAYSAANGNTSRIEHISSYSSLPTNYFSNVTGSFYSSYAAAYAASNGNSSLVDVFNGASTYYDYYDYLYGYYGYGYGYNDPYYYYWLSKNNGSSSSSSKDTTTATLGKRTGWTSIAKYLKNLSNGSSTTVDMNNETVIPSSVTAAIKGRNITVKFVLDNGVTFTVNGKDVTTAKDVDIDTTYNTRSISNKLIKAAYKKNDAVSSAQLSIDAGTLGFTSDLTVKFNAKRGGYKAKLYRYNSAKNSLALVDTATIGSTGKCTFDKVTKGGEFVIVIYK